MNTFCRTSKKLGHRAQAITEFAIVLPILMVLLFGILEAGRLLYTYAVVNNASRDAARYASAVGLDDSGAFNKFEYCKGIVDAAMRFAYFIPKDTLTITIEYDKGPGTTVYDSCLPLNGVDVVPISPGDRVLVTITGTYNPLVKLIPISPKTFTASSARTILGEINLATGAGSIPGPGPGPAPTPTATSAGPIPTNTPTATPTNTQSKDPWITFTPTTTPTDTATPTNTPTLDPNAPTPTDTPTPDPNTPTATPTPIPTNTPTNTATATPTYTPTATSTAMPGCDSISRGQIYTPGDTNTMTMTITNPHGPITVSSVEVHWNYLTGAPGGGGKGSLLTLQYASLGNTQFFSGSNSSGNLIITPTTTVVIIPGNNVTSTITFTFNKPYRFPDTNVDFIRINLATLGCENYSIQRP